ncbi:MAG: 4-aminobutyrate aminotransferase [Chloroflexota bacterium]|jgi:4-aminobutyrate aminotransferase|nr:4-aminobutyrate aminotransferase [Chloroflexota bacterium]
MTDTLVKSATSASEELAARSDAHLSPVMARYFQTAWTRGEGHRLYDADGKVYLDFACGIATTVLGHQHPAVTAAAHAQIDQLWHMCNGLGYLEPVTQLADALAEVLPAGLDSVFFGNSGTEAIEGAIKLARRSTGRGWVIGFAGGFHGRSYGSLSMTSSNLNYRVGHGPFLPETFIAPFPAAYRDFGGDEALATEACLGFLRTVLATQIPPSEVAAFLIEPVQGEGGYYPAPDAFLRGLRELADEHGILLIADEVQTGYGRTGRMWGFESSGIVPDIITLAKGIANGLPLGAVVASRQRMERWGRGAHGSTFGGNPVACAAGVAVLEEIRSAELVDNSAARGAELTAGLRELAASDARIGDVRGPGLMIGVELVKAGGTADPGGTAEPDGALADAVMARCLDDGLVLLTCGAAHNIVRWIAPLNVTSAECQEALGIFKGALAAV